MGNFVSGYLWMGYLTMKPYTKPSKEYLYYLGNVSGKLNAHKESFLEEEDSTVC